MDISSTLVYILMLVVTVLCVYARRRHAYWMDKGVIHLKPHYFYGNFKEVLKRKVHLTEVLEELYTKIKTQTRKFGGFYVFYSPHFFPVDLDLVKRILYQDFAYFSSHGAYVNEEKDPLTGHLFNLDDEKWKNLRAKLTPTFTSGKMKMMFRSMVDCTQNLQEVLNKLASCKEPVDIKDILGCFTTDVIGSVAFGLEINSMKNPDCDFRKFGRKVLTPSLNSKVIFIIRSLLPKWLSKTFGIKMYDKHTQSFYINLVKDTVTYREQNNIYRKDFLHQLIQLKNLGHISDDDGSLMHNNSSNVLQGLTLNEMVAQSFIFYIAGFETSATTMTFALLELAQCQDIQEIARNEINSVLNQHHNKITYDAIMEMKYLEKVVLETLRKHPPVGVLPRLCNKKYKVPDSDVLIDVGTTVSIPVFSIHRDPENYPDPEKFDPERFNEESIASRHRFAYLPFGEGPRMCLGLRFGKLQAKVGLCCVLKNYRVTLHQKTHLPIKYETGFISSVKGGVWINLEPVTLDVKC